MDYRFYSMAFCFCLCLSCRPVERVAELHQRDSLMLFTWEEAQWRYERLDSLSNKPTERLSLILHRTATLKNGYSRDSITHQEIRTPHTTLWSHWLSRVGKLALSGLIGFALGFYLYRRYWLMMR